jgi:hypothetical protein
MRKANARKMKKGTRMVRMEKRRIVKMEKRRIVKMEKRWVARTMIYITRISARLAYSRFQTSVFSILRRAVRAYWKTSKLLSRSFPPSAPRIRDFLRSFAKKTHIPHVVLSRAESPSSWPAIDAETDGWWDRGISEEPVLPNAPLWLSQKKSY